MEPTSGWTLSMKRRSFLAVALLAAFPVASLFATNADQAAARQVPRSLLLSILAAWLLLTVTRLLTRDWARAAYLTAGFVLLFYSYGHVYSLVEGVSIAGFNLGRHRYLAPLWGVLAAGWAYATGIRARRRSLNLTPLLAVAAVLLVSPLLPLAGRSLSLLRPRPAQPTLSPAQVSSASATSLPDIYYIIVDGYGRSDVLQDLYTLDNSDFVSFLERRGFFVASDARSNYSKTILSLASSLNMRYLDDIVQSQGPDSTDPRPLIAIIQDSMVQRTLAASGCRTVGFETGYAPTELTHADVYLSPPSDSSGGVATAWAARGVNEFESLLLETTVLRPVIDKYVQGQNIVRSLISQPYQNHRRHILFTLSELPKIASMDGCSFVFAHVLAPHPPFVFGRRGEELVPTRPFRLVDVDYYPRSEYIERYRDQLLFLDTQLESTIDQILQNSDRTPIIILQGDHGPGAYMDYTAPLTTNMRDRMSILDAYLVPPDVASRLYPSITPVNSFRVLFSGLLGQSWPLLPDESYFTMNDTRRYDLIRVTDRAKTD
jgi:hypothetical protein